MIGKRCCDTCWLPETVAWFSLVGLIRSAEIYTRWNKGSLISIARSRKYTFSNISATHDCMLVLSDHGSSLSPIANALEYGDLKISLPMWAIHDELSCNKLDFSIFVGIFLFFIIFFFRWRRYQLFWPTLTSGSVATDCCSLEAFKQCFSSHPPPHKRY